MSTHNMFSWRNNKNVITFWLKDAFVSVAMVEITDINIFIFLHKKYVAKSIRTASLADSNV